MRETVDFQQLHHNSRGVDSLGARLPSHGSQMTKSRTTPDPHPSIPRLPDPLPVVVLERLQEEHLRALLQLVAAASEAEAAFLHFVARDKARTIVSDPFEIGMAQRIAAILRDASMEEERPVTRSDDEGSLAYVPVVSGRSHGTIGVVGEAGDGMASALARATSVVSTHLHATWEAIVREQGTGLLRESEARFRSLVEGSRGVFVYLHDPDGRFLYLSPAVEDVLGYPASELAGRSYDMLLVDEEEQQRVAGLTQRSLEMQRAGPVVYSAITRHRDGHVVVIELVETPVVEEGSVIGVHGFARDITERVEAEKELRRQKAYLERLFEAAPEGIVLLDPEERVVRANEEFLRLFGYEREEAEGALLDDLIIPDRLQEEAEDLTRRVAEGERVQHETLRRRKDGSECRVAVLGTPVEMGGGRIGVFGIYRDVTEERSREEQLRRSERLASLGTLLSGAAHELNNPLTSLRSFVQLMLTEDRSEEDREALEIMEHEAERAAKVVADLRLFSGDAARDSAERQALDLNAVVRHVLRLRDYPLRNADVALDVELEEDLPFVVARRAELEQVLINLVINAEQALAGHHRSRKLTVRTASLSRGEAIQLTVADSGPGIDQGDLPLIFDPFWTTKDPGEGTGLGLSVVHRIVTELGGEVRVQSSPGSGTTFVVELPTAQTASVTPEAKAPDEDEPPRRLRVLVVDDEPAIRRSVSRYLSRRGHSVEEASCGQTALARVNAAAGDGFDALLVDFRMPGMGGDALMKALRERDDALAGRIVFMTGDAASPDTARFLDGADRPVLLKPFELRTAAEMLESVAEPS